MDVEINLVAVLLATLISIIVGWVWYMPQTFGGPWMRMENIKPEKGNMGRAMGLVFVSSFIMAYVLAHATFLSHHFFNNSFMQDALTTAFWMWLGFQGLRFWMHDEFRQVPTKSTLIHISNDLVVILSMAVVIGLFKP